MTKNFNSQKVFTYFIESTLTIICICVVMFAGSYFSEPRHIKQVTVASGPIISKLDTGSYHYFSFDKKPPVVVTEETYYKFEEGESVVLTRNDIKDESMSEFISFLVGLFGTCASVYLVFNCFVYCGLLRDYLTWGRNHSNSCTFEEYLKTNKK